MKLVSWNVNGIRACLRKGFLEYFNEVNADIFCIQETKLQEGLVSLDLEEYTQYWNYAVKKGYSGTAIFTKKKPLTVSYDVNIVGQEVENEGRVITLEFEEFYLVNVYTPNSQRDLARLEYRLVWEECFQKYLKELDALKPVILCGDLNVAHKEIDLKNPKSNRKNSGFTEEEREKMTKLLESGFIDTFRFFYLEKQNAYTWWSYMMNVRERNIGWRIDYFIVSDRFKDLLIDSQIHSDIMGSDHCPVVLEIQDLN
jgi:exodeoxyribonuclease-3